MLGGFRAAGCYSSSDERADRRKGQGWAGARGFAQKALDGRRPGDTGSVAETMTQC